MNIATQLPQRRYAIELYLDLKLICLPLCRNRTIVWQEVTDNKAITNVRYNHLERFNMRIIRWGQSASVFFFIS